MSACICRLFCSELFLRYFQIKTKIKFNDRVDKHILGAHISIMHYTVYYLKIIIIIKKTTSKRSRAK